MAPERLLRSLLLQIFYSVRSERMLIEKLECKLQFRWFVTMQMDEVVSNHTVFSKKSGAFAERGDRGGVFPTGARAGEAAHVGRTLRSGRDTDRGLGRVRRVFGARTARATRWAREERSVFTETSGRTRPHESTADPDARLFKKSKGSEANLGDLGHTLM
jgi:hypothetical protein